MGGTIDNLNPDYNKEIDQLNARTRAMIKKILAMIKELGTEEEKDLVFWRTDFLEEYGKLIRKAADYRQSVVNRDYLKDMPEWKPTKLNDAL